MQAIEEHFLLDGQTAFTGLLLRDCWANDHFTIRKGNDIGLGVVFQKAVMHVANGGAGDERDLDGLNLHRERTGEKRQCCFKLLLQQTNRKRYLVLLIG